MATYRKFGDTLNLEIQLGNGDRFPTTRVFAQIDRLDGVNIVPAFEMPKIGVGKYTSTANTMPTDDAILVTYFIRKTDGVTAEKCYNPFYLTEVFLRDFTSELIAQNLDAKISTTLQEDLEATINTENNLETSFEDVELQGTVENMDELTGVIQDEC